MKEVKSLYKFNSEVRVYIFISHPHTFDRPYRRTTVSKVCSKYLSTKDKLLYFSNHSLNSVHTINQFFSFTFFIIFLVLAF